LRLLADTQVWLWLQADPGRIRREVLDLLEDPANEVLLSAASAWEIAIKHALSKLVLPLPPPAYVSSRLAASGTTALAVTVAHATHVSTLPPHHRDPFDRLLVAQAQVERLRLVTADPQVERYDVDVLRAR
jgi:PIN domain nuclease of toxin-antitoxin system